MVMKTEAMTNIVKALRRLARRCILAGNVKRREKDGISGSISHRDTVNPIVSWLGKLELCLVCWSIHSSRHSQNTSRKEKTRPRYTRLLGSHGGYGDGSEFRRYIEPLRF